MIPTLGENEKQQLSHQQLLIQRNNLITSKINTRMIKDILSKDLSIDGNTTYHIRNITKGISLQYPEFNELSISKQRRVIMNILEKETELFEKVGWGLWKLKEDDDEETSSNKEDTIPVGKHAEEKKPGVKSNTSGVVKIKRRSSTTGNNDSMIITPSNNDSNFMMPMFNSKERTTSISNIGTKNGVLVPTTAFTNNKFIHLSKTKNLSYKFNNNKYNENALESSEEDADSSSEEENGAGTDEEDWKSLGAENLLFSSNSSANLSGSGKREQSAPKPQAGIVKSSHPNIHRTSSTKEENAAMLLIQLRRGSQ